MNPYDPPVSAAESRDWVPLLALVALVLEAARAWL